MTVSADAWRRHLELLGVMGSPPPTLDTLVDLHRRHLARVPYDNLDIVLGRTRPVDLDHVVDHWLKVGRVGYCFHQNALFGGLLEHLGFAVSRWRGHVWREAGDRDDLTLNHLALVVHDRRPAGGVDRDTGGDWWADVGLGDGFAEPLPLREGEHGQHGWTYGLARRDGGWSLRHDVRGGFTGLEIRPRPAVSLADAAAAHAHLAADRFARFPMVFRRDAEACSVLLGITAARVDAAGRAERTLHSYEEWRGELVELGCGLDDVTDDELRALHRRTVEGHEAWVAAGRP